MQSTAECPKASPSGRFKHFTKRHFPSAGPYRKSSVSRPSRRYRALRSTTSTITTSKAPRVLTRFRAANSPLIKAIFGTVRPHSKNLDTASCLRSCGLGSSNQPSSLDFSVPAAHHQGRRETPAHPPRKSHSQIATSKYERKSGPTVVSDSDCCLLDAHLPTS